jgi:hypothetical protein
MTELDQPGADEAPELEKVASAMGWRPDGGAKTAADYIRDTADINRSLKQRIERQEQEFKQRSERNEAAIMRGLELQRQKIEREYAAAMRNAASVGDADQYDRLQQGLANERQQFQEQVAPVMQPQRQETQQQHAPPPEVAEFATRNSWYMTDKVKTAAAIVMLDEVDQKFPNFALADRLKMVEREMGESFPDLKRSNGQSSGPPSVEGGLRQIRTNRGKGFNELPPEAKSAAKVFINQGVFKTADDYAKAYWKENQE